MLKPNKIPRKNIKSWLFIFIWLLICIIFGAIAGSALYLIATSLLNAQGSSSILSLLVGIVSYGTVIVVLVFGINKLFKQPDVLAALGMRGRLTWNSVFWMILAGAVYFTLSWVLIALIAKFVPGFDPNALKNYGRDISTIPIVVITGFLQVAILTPIIEEVLFRGYIFGELERFKMPIALIVVVTSLLFGFLHYPPWVWVVDTTIAGTVLAVLRYKTKSIWAGVILHIFINTIGFITLFVYK